MEAHEAQNGSALFLVRLWQTERGGSGREWRGRIIHVVSGKACNFIDLPAVGIAFLTMMDDGQEKLGWADGDMAPKDGKKGGNSEE